MYDKAVMIGELNQCLFRLREPMLQFLSEILPVISVMNISWKNEVMAELKKDKQSSKIIKDEGISNFEELDMYLLLYILLKKWEQFKHQFNSLNDQKYFNYFGKFDDNSLVRKIKKIRNTAAHPNNTLNTELMQSMLEDLISFANFINTDKEIVRSMEVIKSKYKKYQHNSEFETQKNERIQFIEENVMMPALNNPELIDDIKDSVLTTLYRLKKKQTIQEIDDLFLSVQAGSKTRGKKIMEELHRLDLKAFEDISEEYVKKFIPSDMNII